MTDSRAPATRPASAGGRPRTRVPGRPAAGMAPPGVWGRTGYVLSGVVAALVVGASGLSYMVVHDVSSIGGSHAPTRPPPQRPPKNPMMPVGSRTDREGDSTPPRPRA